MIQIRPTQMKKLSEYMVLQFVEATVNHLYEIQTAVTDSMEPAQLRFFVRDCIRFGQTVGILTETDLQRLVSVVLSGRTTPKMLVTQKWAMQILRSDSWAWEKNDDLEAAIALRSRQTR